MASASSICVAAQRHRPVSGGASGGQASHQRVLVLRVRKPPKPPGFRETAGCGTPHFHRIRRIRDESSGQSSIEQKAADALESSGSTLSSPSASRVTQPISTRRLSNGEPPISGTFWIQLCRLRIVAPPLRSTPSLRKTHKGGLKTNNPADQEKAIVYRTRGQRCGRTNGKRSNACIE